MRQPSTIVKLRLKQANELSSLRNRHFYLTKTIEEIEEWNFQNDTVLISGAEITLKHSQTKQCKIKNTDLTFYLVDKLLNYLNEQKQLLERQITDFRIH